MRRPCCPKKTPKEDAADIKALLEELAKAKKDNRTLAGLVEKSRKLDVARQREVKLMQDKVEKIKAESEEIQRSLAKRDREVAGYLTTVKKLKHALRQLSKGEKHLKQARGVMSPIQRAQQFPGASQQPDVTAIIPAPPAGGKPKRGGGRAGVLTVGSEIELPAQKNAEQIPIISPISTKNDATVFITESNQNPESNSPEAEAALAATSPTSPTAADEMRVSAALQSQGGMSIMSQSYDDDFEDEEDTTAS